MPSVSPVEDDKPGKSPYDLHDTDIIQKGIDEHCVLLKFYCGQLQDLLAKIEEPYVDQGERRS